MTTTTREQAFDQWLKARFFETVDGRSEFITTCTRDLMREAHTAGREQGLREAKEVCEALSTKVYDHAKPPYLSCAAAIEQLRAPRATLS